MNEEILNQDIVNEIAALKQEKDAVILAHYYVRPEVQAIADYIGDSFYLSKVAANLDAKTIVFAGVFFMGESAKKTTSRTRGTGKTRTSGARKATFRIL